MSAEPFNNLTRAARPGDKRRKMDARAGSSARESWLWALWLLLGPFPFGLNRRDIEVGVSEEEGDVLCFVELEEEEYWDNWGADNFLVNDLSEALAADAGVSMLVVFVAEEPDPNIAGMDTINVRRPSRFQDLLSEPFPDIDDEFQAMGAEVNRSGEKIGTASY